VVVGETSTVTGWLARRTVKLPGPTPITVAVKLRPVTGAAEAAAVTPNMPTPVTATAPSERSAFPLRFQFMIFTTITPLMSRRTRQFCLPCYDVCTTRLVVGSGPSWERVPCKASNDG
jgi:hypothetical protein